MGDWKDEQEEDEEFQLNVQIEQKLLIRSLHKILVLLTH